MSELTDAETQRLRESIKALEQRDGADASIVREGAVCAMTRRQGRNNVVPTGEDYEAAREAIASLIRDRVAPGLRAPTNDPIRQAYSLVIDALYADWAQRMAISGAFFLWASGGWEEAMASIEAVVAAHEAEVEQRFVKWLVEDAHYPFDISFETAPPVNHDLIAEHWRIWDKWLDVTPEEARATIRDEADQ